jgi:transcriptional regulator with XRE-family HTH domain
MRMKTEFTRSHSMSNQTLAEWVKSQADGGREFAQERLIVAITEQVCELMAHENVSKSELAAGLHKSKAYVSQLLRGTRNMTLRTLADLAYVLGRNVSVHFSDRTEAHSWQSFSNVVSLQRRPIVQSAIEAQWMTGAQWAEPNRSSAATESKAA